MKNNFEKFEKNLDFDPKKRHSIIVHCVQLQKGVRQPTYAYFESSNLRLFILKYMDYDEI